MGRLTQWREKGAVMRWRHNERVGRRWRDIGRCRRGVAAVEFALVATPFLLLLFGCIATNTLLFTWSAMQTAAQYAAQMVSTGQITKLSTGTITSSNNTATTKCSSTLTSSEAEYYACTGLPGWGTFTVTTTESCAVPSVTVSLSAAAGTAAVADVFKIFTKKTLTAQAVVMKQGTCP